ncbi:DUF2399 domain-containing protein [Actinomycetospora aeridis]|uniref:DUF2399 domain-containing protein n=1 Tax=Actinomycetospora aeridis TaxID=3129231 RepID=A0ABU8N981_9PSEU
MTVPPVLLEPAFDPLWRSVSAALDRRGLTDRRPVALPQGLDPQVYARIGEVLGHRFATVRRRLDLAALDAGLAARGTDLVAVLTAAGHAPTGRKEARDDERSRRDDRDTTLIAAADQRLGPEPWVAAWVASVRPSVPDAATAARAVDVVTRVLEQADHRRSRGEVAARVLGSAHALDPGTLERRWVRAALVHRAGSDATETDLWADAGLPGDVVSVPTLTWALPLLGDGVAAGVRALTAAGAPAPLTTLTTRDLRLEVPPATVVLSVENPRLLELAAQQRLAAPLLCTSGEPTSGALALIDALRQAGAVVRHHGDIDVGGLGITRRLADRGVVPWRMGVDDYRDAVARADVALPEITAAVPATPWDPDLQGEVQRAGVAIEQERVMDDVLAAHVIEAGRC